MMNYKTDLPDVDDDGVQDMYLAAIILSLGGTITYIDKKNPRRRVFYFDMSKISHIYVHENDVPMKFPNPTLEDIKIHAADQTLWLPPNYPSSLRSIKSAIYN